MCTTCQIYFWRINIEKLWKISVACVAHTIPVVGVVFIVVAIISATIIRPALIIMGLCCSVVYYCADYYGIMEIFLPFVSHSSVIRCLFLSKPIQLHDSWFFTTSNRKHYLVLLRSDFWCFCASTRRCRVLILLRLNKYYSPKEVLVEGTLSWQKKM